jgi:hypothetical protein
MLNITDLGDSGRKVAGKSDLPLVSKA